MEQITAIESSVVSQTSSNAVATTVSKSFSASVGGGVGAFSGNVTYYMRVFLTLYFSKCLY